MTEKQAIEFLASRKRLGAAKQPAAMAALMAALGNVQDKLRFVHITGTNGKGSTAKMIAGILTAAGYKTGLNVSPYVQDFKERMTIDGKMIGARALGNAVKQVKTAALAIEQEGHYVTEFECTTAAALVWYAQENCDFVVLEVGIGGEHDATNIVKNTAVACITPISLDHTDRIGETVAQIAEEKCGIFKPGCTAVIAADQPEEAWQVIEKRAAALGVPVRRPEKEDIRVLWSTLRENHIDYGGYEVSLRLAGAHQAGNAAMAVEAALALCDQGFEIDDEAILEGLAAARMPARIEMMRFDPLYIIDGSHNPGGGEALAAALKGAKAEGLTAIIGMMGDKDVGKYLDTLKGCFGQVYTVPACDMPRAMHPDLLARLCAERFARVEAKNSFEEAFAAAEKRGAGICVCGSFYLAGYARGLYTKK